jgi:hypothetical protein
VVCPNVPLLRQPDSEWTGTDIILRSRPKRLGHILSIVVHPKARLSHSLPEAGIGDGPTTSNIRFNIVPDERKGSQS